MPTADATTAVAAIADAADTMAGMGAAAIVAKGPKAAAGAIELSERNMLDSSKTAGKSSNLAGRTAADQYTELAVLAGGLAHEIKNLTIYVIDVSAGDKIPRKGGPGITRSDLLVINKIDLAPFVGASLEVMDRDAQMRGDRPFVFANSAPEISGLPEIAAFIETDGGLRSGGTA